MLHSDVAVAESDAHKQLAHARLFGEWFDLRDFDVDQWLARREADDQINALYDRYLAATGKNPFGPALIMGDC